jgi:hypothetical protein
MGGVGSGIKGHRTFRPGRIKRMQRASEHGFRKLVTAHRNPRTSPGRKAKIMAALRRSWSGWV